jgi:hypothetical protein
MAEETDCYSCVHNPPSLGGAVNFGKLFDLKFFQCLKKGTINQDKMPKYCSCYEKRYAEKKTINQSL